MGRGFFKSVPRLIAVFGVLPLLLLMLWLTWHVAAKSLDVHTRWQRVLAQVVEVTDDTVTLQVAWQGTILRGDVKRQRPFAELVPYESVTLLANPDNPAELSPAGFAAVWSGAIALAVGSFILAAVCVILWRRRSPPANP